VAVAVVVAAGVAADVEPVPPRLNPPKSGFWAAPEAAVGPVGPDGSVEAGAKGDGLLAPPLSGAAGLENKFDAFCTGGCAPNRGVEDVG
jgi:hypothetical protein